MSPVAAMPPAVPVLHAPVSQQAAPGEWQTHTVRAGETVFDLAIRHETTVAAIVQRNGLAHGGRLITAGATLQVPRTAAGPTASTPTKVRASTSAAARAAKTPARQTSSVTVRHGETLSHIAARLKVSVASLIKANRLSSPDVVHVGQVLKVSRPGSGAPAASRSAGAPGSAAPAASHTVRPGDTLWGIAQRHGLTLSALRRANSGISSGHLAVGQQVAIPSSGTKGTQGTQGAQGQARPFTPETIGEARSGEQVANRFLHYTYPSAVARSAAANKDYLAGAPVPSRQETRQLITTTAKRHGVDPRLALAISWQESGWNQRAVSPANAIGAMQVIPTSGEWASQLAGRQLNLFDPHDNVTAGVVIIRALLRAAGNEDEAIAGYYQGLAGVQRNGMYADTRQYVNAVKALRSRM